MIDVKILTADGCTYATAGKKLVAALWRAGDQWYVGGPGYPAVNFGDERDSVDAFMHIALGGKP